MWEPVGADSRSEKTQFDGDFILLEVEGREDHYVVPLLPSLTATSYYIQTEVIIDIEEGSGIEFLTMFAGEMALLSNYTWSVVKPNAKVVMRISELEDEVEAEDVEKDFEIFIKTRKFSFTSYATRLISLAATGVTLSVRIKGSETVLALKSKIEGFGPPDAQRLEFAGKQLEEDQTMAYYSIVDQSMLQLVTT